MSECNFIIEIMECILCQIKYRSFLILLISLRLRFPNISRKWNICYWAFISQDQSRTSLNKPLKDTVNSKSSASTVSLYRSAPTSQQYLLMKTQLKTQLTCMSPIKERTKTFQVSQLLEWFLKIKQEFWHRTASNTLNSPEYGCTTLFY